MKYIVWSESRKRDDFGSLPSLLFNASTILRVHDTLASALKSTGQNQYSDLAGECEIKHRLFKGEELILKKVEKETTEEEVVKVKKVVTTYEVE